MRSKLDRFNSPAIDPLNTVCEQPFALRARLVRISGPAGSNENQEDGVADRERGEENSRAIPICVEDPTRVVEAERQSLLREAATRAAELDAIFESMADGLVVCASDGRMIRANPAVQELLGFPLDKLAVGSVTERVHTVQLKTEDGQIMSDEQTANQRALRGEVVRGMTEIVERADGEQLWLSVSAAPIRAQGDIVGAVVSFTDVTERKKLGDALRETESRFRRIADAAPLFIYELDAQGQHGFFNRRWAEYTGRDPGDQIERLKLVHPEDVSRVRAAWSRSAETGANYECEYRIRRYDGEYRWFLSRAIPLLDGARQPTRWFGTATDIHDLKSAQAELREADERKNDFLSILSHELRNPLSPIRNANFILSKSSTLDDRGRRATEVIERQIEHLTRLVDDLLDVTRVSRGKMRLERSRIDIVEVVRGLVDDHRSILEHHEVVLTLPGTPVFVDADPTRLAQVIDNLLHNATKFTPEAGHITIAVRVEGDSAIIDVIDTGIGIDSDVLPNLFNPFVQADASLARSRAGLGLGLALVKGIVELHGGSVRAISAGSGKGAQFNVVLPLYRGSPTQKAENRISRVTMSGTKRVLVIDDEVDAANCMVDTLSLLGDCDASAVYSGKEGVALARIIRPHIVFCDVGLPDMNGYDVARALRADSALSGIFLVALTGYAQPEDKRRALASGFHAHLAKPADFAKLEQVLENATLLARDA